MNLSKNILLAAAITGLVAGAAANAQADHHEGEKAAAEKNSCKGKDHAKGDKKGKGKKAKRQHKCGGNGCGADGNGCHTPEAKAKAGAADATAPATEQK